MKSQNSRNHGFSYYFCLMIEGSVSRAGSGSVSRAGSGSVPLTNGSGSRRPKNKRVHNTVMKVMKQSCQSDIGSSDVTWKLSSLLVPPTGPHFMRPQYKGTRDLSSHCSPWVRTPPSWTWMGRCRGTLWLLWMGRCQGTLWLLWMGRCRGTLWLL